MATKKTADAEGFSAEERKAMKDRAAELRTLDFIRKSAPETAPGFDPDLALFLWREYVIPWTRQSEVDHLAAP